jgi:hypothetical protein
MSGPDRERVLLALLDFPINNLDKKKMPRPLPRNLPPNPSRIAPNIRSAISLLSKKHFSRAATQLLREEAPLPADWRKRLEDLHPFEAPTAPIGTSTHFAAANITADEVFNAIVSHRDGKAPGPSGWTEELLFHACACPTTKRAVTAIISDIANNRVSSTVARRLRQCRLVALGKEGGGLRPIAVGEVLARVAGTVVLNRCLPFLRETFLHEGQYALERGGCETIIHLCRQALSGDNVLVTLDCKNAFNSVHRAAIRQVLISCPELSPLLPMWDLLYAASSELLVADGDLMHTIFSTSGVRQGDVLGPVFFCLALLPIFRSLPTDLRGHSLSFMDDITIAGNGTRVIALVTYLRQALRHIGLDLNCSKCHVFSHNASISAGVANLLDFVDGTDGAPRIKVLGAWLGSDPAVALALDKKATAQTKLLDKLAQVPAELAFALVRLCASPRWNFYIRTHAPTTTNSSCAIFDERLTRAVCDIASIDVAHLSPLSTHLITLPISLGGLGVTLLHHVAAVAYTASATSADQQHLSRPIWQALAATVDGDKLFKRHRATCICKGASLWLDPPTEDDTLMPSSLFSLALQSRLLAQAADRHLVAKPNATMTCECGFTASKQQWAAHTEGCSVRRGYNASRRADATNAEVRNFVAQQPRGAAVAMELEPQVKEAVFADALFHTDRGVLLLDWGTFSPDCSSAPSAATVEARKALTYNGAKANVIACAISSAGGLSRQTAQAIKAIEEASGAEPRSLRRHLCRTIVRETASMARSARIRAQAGPPSSVRRTASIIENSMPANELPEVSDDDETPYEQGLTSSKPPTTAPPTTTPVPAAITFTATPVPAHGPSETNHQEHPAQAAPTTNQQAVATGVPVAPSPLVPVPTTDAASDLFSFSAPPSFFSPPHKQCTRTISRSLLGGGN